MNKQPNSSKILDILLRNMLSEQIKWDRPEDKKRYQYQSLQTKDPKDIQRGGTERIKMTGGTELFDKKTGLSKKDFKDIAQGWNFYKNGRIHDAKGRRGNSKFNASTGTLDITWDEKKYGKASEQGLDPRFYTVLFLIIGIGTRGFGASKLIKFLKGKGVSLRYLMRGGIYKDAWNWFRGKNGKVNMEAGVEKLYAEGHITRELRDEMLERLKDPRIAIEMETAFMKNSLSEFMKGGPNAPTAKEFLASLTDKLRDKYGEQIRNIERKRTKTSTVSKLKPKTMSSITPKAVKNTYTKLSPVTGEQFDKVIKGTKAQSIIDDIRATFGDVTARREIDKLKNSLVSGKASKINKNFKSKSEFETFITKTDPKIINTPRIFNTQQIELEWAKHRLKQLFK
jgi:hypothetical protein